VGSDIHVKTQIEGVWEQHVEENIWSSKGENERKLEKNA
jgi:hypothetical protein